MSMREKEMMRIAFVLFGIGLVIIACAFAVCGFSPLELSRRVSGYEQKTVDLVDTFTSVRIENVDANVYLLPSEDGKCSVIYDETDRSTHHVKIGDGTLVVERKRSWLDSFGFFMSAPKLTVYLPEAEYREIYAHTVSGSVRMEGLNCGSLDLQTTSGKIRLSNVNVKGDAALKCVSGSIKLTSVQAGSLSARTTSGSIRLEGVDAEDMEMRSVSGSIKGELFSAKSYEASSVSGRVRVPESVPGAGLCRASTTSGSITISVAE